MDTKKSRALTSHTEETASASQSLHPQDGSYHLLISLKATAAVVMVHSVQNQERLTFYPVYF